MIKKDSFVAQTAFDYDIDYWIVDSIYKETNGGIRFYERLEEYLKEKRNQ